MESTTDLPKGQVKRIVQTKLKDLYGPESSQKRNAALSKDALTALSESGRVFIGYISSLATEYCHESRRNTVTAEDIIEILKREEFGEFHVPLLAALEDFRVEQKEKSRKRAEKKQAKESAKEKADVEQTSAAMPVTVAETRESTNKPVQGPTPTQAQFTGASKNEASESVKPS